MQSIASGSFSQPESSSNRESLGGGSLGPSNDDTSGGRPVSSLNVLAKPFISPGVDATPSDSMSLGLKEPAPACKDSRAVPFTGVSNMLIYALG